MKNRIREFRERRDLSQDEVARFLGVNRTAVVKWETGANKPRLDKIVELAKLPNQQFKLLKQLADNVSSKYSFSQIAQEFADLSAEEFYPSRILSAARQMRISVNLWDWMKLKT